MKKILEKPILFGSVILLLCGYLFFFRLGGMALTDPDETFYAQTAREMLDRGEWATPYLYGKPQFEKPILFYWLVELSFRIFGVNEFAARFPSAVFAFLGVIVMYFLGKLLFNKRVGVFACLMLATNVEYVILSRACVTDMVLFTLMLSGALFFFYGYLKGRTYFYLLSAAAFGFATLTKGPVFLALPLAVILIYLAWIRDMKAFKKIPLFRCAIVFLAVALPWYLLIYKLHGKEFIDAFFGFHNVNRFLEAEHKIGSQVYYNIPIILGGYFPWSVFLPFGLWHAFKKARDAKRETSSAKNGMVFVLVWLAVIFLFFTASSTKLPTYIFPCFISLALITAVLWDDFLKAGAPKELVGGVKFSYYLLPVIAVFGTIGALIFIHFDYPVISSGIAVCCLFLIFGIFLSLIAFMRKNFIAAFFLVIYSLMIFVYPLSALVLPVVERYETSKVISLKLLSMMKAGEKIASESNFLAGLAFYTGRFPRDIDKHHALVGFINQKEKVWCVMKEKNHRDLYDPRVNPDYVKPSYMVYKLKKRAIITNETPENGSYMLKREKSG